MVIYNVRSGAVEVMVGVAMVEVAEEVAAEAMEVEAMAAEDTDRALVELTICSTQCVNSARHLYVFQFSEFDFWNSFIVFLWSYM